MDTTTSAIVLHALRYGEADLIVKLYTRSDGLRSYLLKGVLKAKKGKIRASYFQPLSLLEIQSYHRNKGNLEYLRDVKIRKPFSTLHTTIVKSSMVLFLSDILKNCIKEEASNEELFDFLETSLLWLDTQEEIGNFHLVFLITLTKYLGFYPDTRESHKPYFNLAQGIFQDEDNGIQVIQGSALFLLKQFLNINFETSLEIALSKKDRGDLLELLLRYFALHLQGFQKPKSLSVLNEIYQ